MSALVLVILSLSLLLNCILLFACFRLSRRLLQFDDLFDLLQRDIDTNVSFFKKLLSTPLFENSQEVRSANSNMNIISKRLEEFSVQMDEIRNDNKTSSGQ